MNRLDKDETSRLTTMMTSERLKGMSHHLEQREHLEQTSTVRTKTMPCASKIQKSKNEKLNISAPKRATKTAQVPSTSTSTDESTPSEVSTPIPKKYGIQVKRKDRVQTRSQTKKEAK
ncbi:hypothetical protein V9T40_003425 [Parthenolecanium corni]|uniref:Uncharacterized protein n=1 Tax=Parthenolecanium corni TaxID=536013 RepID=A0AAN9Y8V3_9HEMI